MLRALCKYSRKGSDGSRNGRAGKDRRGDNFILRPEATSNCQKCALKDRHRLVGL